MQVVRPMFQATMPPMALYPGDPANVLVVLDRRVAAGHHQCFPLLPCVVAALAAACPSSCFAALDNGVL